MPRQPPLVLSARACDKSPFTPTLLPCGVAEPAEVGDRTNAHSPDDQLLPPLRAAGALRPNVKEL